MGTDSRLLYTPIWLQVLCTIFANCYPISTDNAFWFYFSPDFLPHQIQFCEYQFKAESSLCCIRPSKNSYLLQEWKINVSFKCRTSFAQCCLFLYATVRNSTQDSRNKKLCCKPELNMWDPLCTILQLSFAAMLIFILDPSSFFNKLCYHVKSCWSAVCIQWRQQGKRMFSNL